MADEKKSDDEVVMAVARTFYREGLIELMRELSKGPPQRFREFKSVTNMRTGEPLAVSTVNNRLKELLSMGLVRQKPFPQHNGKLAIGYEVTERGHTVIGMMTKCAWEMHSFLGGNGPVKEK